MVVIIDGQQVKLSEITAKYLANELSQIIIHQSPLNAQIEGELSNIELAIRRAIP